MHSLSVICLIFPNNNRIHGKSELGMCCVFWYYLQLLCEEVSIILGRFYPKVECIDGVIVELTSTGFHEIYVMVLRLLHKYSWT